MQKWSLPFFCCPKTKENLTSRVFEFGANEAVKHGVLISEISGNVYPVIDYVPRFVASSLYDTSAFEAAFSEELSKLDYKITTNIETERLKEDTNKYFGWEWQEYKRWGWQENIAEIDDSMGEGAGHAGTITKTKEAFKKKGLIDTSQLKDKIVLDAGCGNGRYSYQASTYGAKVIGIDLGEGSVKAAQENTNHIQEIQIVQGDLLLPPFKDDVFDYCFSIGVLMHTGDAKLAHERLAKTIVKDGFFTAHVYRKGNIIVELTDYLLRKYNKMLSLDGNINFAKSMAHLSQKLSRYKFRGRDLSWWLNHFVELRNTYHQMFDWWSAPVASHHTYQEVGSWFSDQGFYIVKEGNKEYYGFSKWFPPIGVVTIKGQKRQ